MSARRASGGGKRRARSGCLQSAAIVLFALVLGSFAASTWMRHVGRVDGPGTAAELAESSSAPSVERARIRVEVRNGSGISGAAAQVTEYLRAAGFDVVDFGNAAESDRPNTVVIDRIGVPGPAREVAAALQGVPIQSGIDTTLYLDVTVMVGRDAPGLLNPEEPGGDRRGWRRWLDRLGGVFR